ncbi:MAG: type II toxin-antitoxin system prevent-host-death family antitoxin [Wenzhouxiangellaceae bacterium]
MEATTKDLRLKTRELIAATDRGEVVTITYRGKRRARLVPIQDADSDHRDATRNPAFGMWRDLDQAVDRQIDSLRAVRDFD